MNNNLENILAERAKTHGIFENHAFLSQNMKNIAHGLEPTCKHCKWNDLSYSQKESIDMILHKIARILNGDNNHKDHWDDIAGYATLVSKELEQK